MNKFEYVIKDENGIHARPAGLLAKKVQEYGFDITIECNKKSVNPKKLLALMSMGIKKGDRITVSSPESTDISGLKKFFEDNL